jgi:hypothetical protein
MTFAKAPLGRRSTLIALTAAIVATGAALGAAGVVDPGRRRAPDHAAPPTSAAATQMALSARFAPVAADGIDMVWRGALVGTPRGEETVRLRYLGADADRALPLWPVQAVVFVASADVAASMVAELSGTLSWNTGDVRLYGVVTEGRRRDARVEQVLRLDPGTLEGSGTLRVTGAGDVDPP